MRLIACGLDLIYKACGLAAQRELAALRPIRIRGSRRLGGVGLVLNRLSPGEEGGLLPPILFIVAVINVILADILARLAFG